VYGKPGLRREMIEVMYRLIERERLGRCNSDDEDAGREQDRWVVVGVKLEARNEP